MPVLALDFSLTRVPRAPRLLTAQSALLNLAASTARTRSAVAQIAPTPTFALQPTKFRLVTLHANKLLAVHDAWRDFLVTGMMSPRLVPVSILDSRSTHAQLLPYPLMEEHLLVACSCLLASLALL